MKLNSLKFNNPDDLTSYVNFIKLKPENIQGILKTEEGCWKYVLFYWSYEDE